MKGVYRHTSMLKQKENKMQIKYLFSQMHIVTAFAQKENVHRAIFRFSFCFISQ